MCVGEEEMLRNRTFSPFLLSLMFLTGIYPSDVYPIRHPLVKHIRRLGRRGRKRAFYALVQCGLSDAEQTAL